MQEHGVPITYAYISDAHDRHQSGPAYGPGEAGYVAALKSYDEAFAAFFQRLAADGITPANTEFVFTADENDHFVGGTPTPAGCDGVTVPCTYSHVNCPSATISTCPPDNVGEINVNMAGLLATQQGITTPFKVHLDSAPNVYITGNPSRTDPVTRAFEEATAKLTLTDPRNGSTQTVTQELADPVEMQLLHMVTADPARTPTFTVFANPDDFVYAGAPSCPTSYACVQQEFGFAWNHGDVSPDINRTWLGLVGPGIRHLGQTDAVWSDHTDVRPTLMALTGLVDDYRHDGRVLWEVLGGRERARSLAAHSEALQRLGEAYKQLDAAVGEFGLSTLSVSTRAVASESAGDATYSSLESWLSDIGSRRDALADRISAVLDAAEFHDRPVNQLDAMSLTRQANELIQEAQAKAAE